MYPSIEERFHIGTDTMENKCGGVRPDTKVLRSNSSIREGSGLSKSHNVTKKKFYKGRFKEIAQEMSSKPIYGNGTHWIKLYKGGRLVEAKIHSGGCISEFNEKDSSEGAVRGKITKWSRKSQMNFKYKLSTLDQSKLSEALEITLTYPKEFPCADDHEIYKRDLQQIQMWLLRRGFSGAWKLEFQSRGAPHYHILAIPKEKLKGLGELRKAIAEQWYNIVKSGDPKHLQAGTEVSTIKSPEGIIGYMASYMAKKDQTLPNNFTGRYWGFINKKAMPFIEPKVIPLGRKNAALVRRICRNKIKKDMRNYQLRIIAKVLQKDSGIKASAQEVLNAFFRLDAKTHTTKKERQIKDLIKRGWVKHPKKWRLRNNRVTKLFCDPDALEKALICLFAREKRSLKNSGFLP